MADNNRNWGNQPNRGWNQNRDQFRSDNDDRYRENDDSFGNAGYSNDDNSSQGRNRSYENNIFSNAAGSGAGDRMRGDNRDNSMNQGSYNRTTYIPDNDQNRNYNNRNYDDTQYGTSGTYGNTGGYGNDFNPGGYSPMDDRGSFGHTLGYHENRREDWGQRNTGYGAMYSNRNEGEDYNRGSGGYRQENDFKNEGYENRNQPYDRMENERNRGDYDRARTEMSSWFGQDNAVQRGRTNEAQQGRYRGKGPKGYRRSEERIREDVCHRLSEDDYVDATNIQVQVQGDEVILIGNVNSRDEKRRAEDLVESIYGVSNVENRLRVGAGNIFTAHEYTGNTGQTGGIGNESGTTNEIIRTVNNEKENK